MASMLESLAGTMVKGHLSEVAEQLGADERSTSSALSAALPLLMGALARSASEPEGAAALLGALRGKHDGSVLRDLTAQVRAPDLEDGAGILGHVLGERRAVVEQGIGRASGLDVQKVRRLLGMLAPVVMGTVGEATRIHDMDAAALSEMLRKERDEMKGAVPHLDILGKLLDWDDNGEVASDVLGGAARGFLVKILEGR